MATRFIVLPNGNIEEIPANMSDAEAYAALGVSAPASTPKQSLGYVSRVGETVERFADQMGSGIATVGEVGARKLGLPGVADFFREDRARSDRAASEPIPGAATWEEAKAAPFSKGIQYVAEQVPGQILPSAIMALNPIGFAALAAGNTGQIAQQRAQYDNRTEVTPSDLLKAAPAGAISAALDRYGAEKIIGGGTVVRKALTEGATETVQSGAEYTGGALGTEHGFQPVEALDQMAQGGVLGLFGGAAGGVATKAVGRGKSNEGEDDLGPISDDAPTDLLRLPAPTKYVDTQGRVTDSINQAVQAQNAPRDTPVTPIPEDFADLPIGAQPDLFGAGVVNPEPAAPTQQDEGGQAPLDYSNPEPLGPSFFDEAPSAVTRSGYGPREVRMALTGGSKPDAFIMKMSTALTRAFADGNINTARKAIDSEFDRLAKPNNKLQPETVDHRLQVLDRANNLVETYNSEYVSALAQEGQAKAQPGAKVGAVTDKSGAIAQEIEANEKTKTVEEPKLRKQLMERALTADNISDRDKYFEALLKRNNLDPAITDDEFEEIYRTQEAIDAEQTGNTGAAELEAQITPQRKPDVAAALNEPSMAAAETVRAVKAAEETAQGNEARSRAKGAKESAKAEAAQEVTRVEPGEARGLRENARRFPLAEREVVEEAGDLDQQQIDQQETYKRIGEARAANTITDAEQALLTNMIRRGASNDVVRQAIDDLKQQRKREARKTRTRALEGTEPRSTERADRRAKEGGRTKAEQERLRSLDAQRETNIDLQEQQPRDARFPSTAPSELEPEVMDLTNPQDYQREIDYRNRLTQAVRGNNLMQALREIATNDHNPIMRWVARSLVRAGVNVHIETAPEDQMPPGVNAFANFWDNGIQEIIVNENRIRPDVILHEAIHASLIGRMGSFERDISDEEVRRLPPQVREGIVELMETWDDVRKLFIEKMGGTKQGPWVAETLRSLDEFMAYIPTDRDAQRWLASHDMQGNPVALERSIWMRLMDSLRRILGMPAKARSALDEVMRVQSKIFNLSESLPLDMKNMSSQLRRARPGAPRFAQRAQINGKDGSPVFHSGAIEGLSNHPQQKGPAEQWLNLLQPGRIPGVKEEELEWSGVRDWLESRKGTVVDKDEIISWLANNGIEVEEKVLGGPQTAPNPWVVERQQGRDMTPFSARLARYVGRERNSGASNQWQIRHSNPDATMVAPTLYNFTTRESAQAYADSLHNQENQTRWNRWTSDPENPGYRELMLRLPPGVKNNPKDSPDTHWAEKGVVAHVRFMPKQDEQGQPVLHLEEVQSDWHQQGRQRGYAGESDETRRESLKLKLEDLYKRSNEAGNALIKFAKDEFNRDMTVSGARSWLDIHLEDMDDDRRHLQDRIADDNYRGGDDPYGYQLDDEGNDIRPTRAELEEEIKKISDILDRGFPLINADDALLNEIEETTFALTQTDTVPHAPFKKSWPELVMKRMVRWAVDNGYQKISWIKGGEQNGGGTGGGGGWFYDRNLPNTVNNMFKKYGVKVEPMWVGDETNHNALRAIEDPTGVRPHEMETLRELSQQHRERFSRLGFEITPALARQAGEGFQLFQQNSANRQEVPRAPGSSINTKPIESTRAITDMFTGSPTRWTAALDFGWGLAERAAKAGLKSARVYQRLLNERQAISESVERGYVELSERFDKLNKLPGQLTGRQKGSLNWLAKHMVFDGKWAFQPTWLKDEKGRQVKVQVDPELARIFDGMPKSAQDVLQDMFRLPHETLHRKRKAITDFLEKEHGSALDKAQAAYDQAVASGVTDKDALKSLASAVRVARKHREADFERFNRLFNVNLSEPYMPIRRFGDYVVVGRSPEYLAEEQKARATGDDERLLAMKSDPKHYYVDFAETNAGAAATARRVQSELGLQTEKFTKEQAREELLGGRDMFHAFGRLRDLVKNTIPGKEGEKLDKSITDLMLATLITSSSRKSEMARLKVAGGAFDMMRGAISQGRADAQFVGAVHKNDEITDSLSRMRDEAQFQDGARDPAGREERQSLLNEITARHAMSMAPPRPNAIAEKATAFTSLWMLMTAPSFYIQQLTQPGMMSVPSAGGRHGYAQAWKELMRGYKRVSEAWQNTGVTGSLNLDLLPQEYRAMAQYLSDTGRLDVGINKEMGNWSSDGKGAFNDMMHNVVQKLGAVTRKTEAINRLASAAMEYDLQLKKDRIQPIHDEDAYASYLKDMRESHPEIPPMSAREFAAANHAVRLVDETHGSYDMASAPRLMRGDIARVATQFKKFQIMQVRLYAKTIKDAFFDKNLPRAERVIAQKTLGYLLSHAFVMAGLKGLPAATSIMWLVEALKDLFDDDDQPTNLEREFREAVDDPTLADWILHGTPTLGGANLQGSLGQGNALSLAPYADSPISKDPRSAENTYANYLMQLAGPAVGGVGKNFAVGASYMRDGQYYRGLEQMMPRGISAAMRSYREATEGVTSRRGEVQVKPEDIDARQTIYSALGVQPLERSRRQFAKDIFYQDEDFFDGKSTELRRVYANATTPAEKAQVREEWNEHQRARVEAGFKRQPMSSLLRAEKDRKRAKYGAGMRLEKGQMKRAEELEELTGLDEE